MKSVWIKLEKIFMASIQYQITKADLDELAGCALTLLANFRRYIASVLAKNLDVCNESTVIL